MIVLQGFPPHRETTNPYLVMLADSLRSEPDIEVLNFTWKTAFTRRFDIYHTHWPENLGNGSTRLKSMARQLLTLAFLTKLKLQRIPVVRTVHNLERPQGLNKIQSWILDLFDRQTAVSVLLNRHTPAIRGSAVHLIPHGHYIDWFQRFTQPEPVTGRIVFTGLVRRYKGVETLLGAFEDIPDTGLSLCIAGNPTSSTLKEEIESIAARDSRVLLDLKFQSEAEFAARICESELVVLPYHLMHNSGGTLAALSLCRPVLIPDNQINRELAKEVGPGWIFLFQGSLEAQDIVQALEQLRKQVHKSTPNLSARSWAEAGTKHQLAYEQALSKVVGINSRSERSHERP